MRVPAFMIFSGCLSSDSSMNAHERINRFDRRIRSPGTNDPRLLECFPGIGKPCTLLSQPFVHPWKVAWNKPWLDVGNPAWVSQTSDQFLPQYLHVNDPVPVRNGRELIQNVQDVLKRLIADCVDGDRHGKLPCVLNHFE